MLLLDFKLLLWIKHALKPGSENHLAECLPSAFLGNQWLAPLTHSAEKCAVEWFGLERKLSHVLPLWFSFAWEGLGNVSYLSVCPMDHKASFHIPWRSVPMCAASSPKAPVYLEELPSQQSSPSPAYFLLFFTSLPSRLQAVLCNSWIRTKFSVCPAETFWPTPIWFSTHPISQEL